MPLLVQCPRGCEIRMSRNRSGKIVRCPQCKCAMRIPKLTEAQLKMGGIVPCRAKIARRKRIDPEEQARRQEEIIKRVDRELALEERTAKTSSEQNKAVEDHDSTPVVIPKLVLPGSSDETKGDLAKADSGPEKSKAAWKTAPGPEPAVAKELSGQPVPDDSELADESSGEDSGSSRDPIGEPSAPLEEKPELASLADETISSGASTSELPVPDFIRQTGPKSLAGETKIKKSEGKRKKQKLQEAEIAEAKLADGSHSAVDDELQVPLPAAISTRTSLAANTAPISSDEVHVDIPRPPEGIPTFDLDDPGPEIEEDRNWEQRLTDANSDRKMLARFFALCLCFVAIVNMVPAIYHWYHWAQQADTNPLPRWIYIQIFVGALHLIYAFFLAQVPDWSAMRAVSVALLLMAFVFGIVSTGLLVGGTGDLSGYLGIPFALNRQACIWCVAMLCLATLMAYWGGKESANWQRAEHLLKDIVAKPAG